MARTTRSAQRRGDTKISIAIVGLVALSLLVFVSVVPARAVELEIEPDLVYTMQVSGNPVPRLTIEMTFLGGPHGFTVLGGCLSPWPSSPGCGRRIHGLRVRSEASDQSLPAESAEPNIWTIDHSPREPLTVRYEVVPDAMAQESSVFVPVVSRNFVRFLGDTTFLVPEHIVRQPEAGIRFSWTGSIPEAWSAVNSMTIGGPDGTLRLPVPAFLQSLFFVGPTSEDRTDENPVVRVVWLESAPPREVRDAFLTRVVRIRRAVAESLSPAAGLAETCFVLPQAPGDVAAVALTRSLVLLSGLETVADAKDPLTGITLAHEFVHTTPMGRLQVEDGPVPENFLAEALAEFLARRALYRGGLLDLQGWARAVSEKLAVQARRHGSIQLDVPREPFDPYVFGDLLMILVDREIHRSSRGTANIRDLVARLLEKVGHRSRGRISWAAFRDTLRQLTSEAFTQRIERLVEGRQPVRFPDDLFASCVQVAEAPIWEFAPGMDLVGSIEERRVRGVLKHGPAWEAGLRNGESLLEWSVQWGRSDVPVNLVVAAGEATRSVTFLPRGDSVVDVTQRVVEAQNGPVCRGVL